MKWSLHPYTTAVLGKPKQGALLHLTDGEGHEGWGDVAPLPGLSRETLDEVLANPSPVFPSFHFATQSALDEIASPCPAFSLPLSAFFLGTTESILKQAEVAKKEGFTTAKIKLSHLSDEEAAFLINALRHDFRLRIDLNRAWDLKHALNFFSQFSTDAFDYIEEPLSNPEELIHFTHPFALDESLLDLTHFDFPNLKALVLKPTVLGNLSPYIALGKEKNLTLVLGTSYESGVGLAQIARAAYRLGLTDTPIGLDTYKMLSDPIRPLTISDGRVHLSPQLVKNLHFLRPEGPTSVLAQGNALGESKNKKCSLKGCKSLAALQAASAFPPLPRALPWAKTLVGPSGLKKNGRIRKRQRVAFVAAPSMETVELIWECLEIGAVICPLSTRLPEQLLKQVVQELDPHVWIDPTTRQILAENPNAPLTDEPIAALLSTSGSSGKPKIAALSLENFIENARGALPAFSLSEESTWLINLPLFHVGGLSILFRSFLSGCKISFTPDRSITHASFVPTQLYRMIKENNPLLAQLKMILLGGAHTPASLLEKAATLPLHTSYGMTETASLMTFDGVLLPNREMRLASDGEIWVLGKTRFLGYWQNGQLNPQEGWFATGDLGIFRGGKWEIVGRKDNLFISGGENIQPEEIEQVLLTLPGILQAVVVPRSDPEFGARPVAFIDSAAAYTLETLRTFLEEKLPHFKFPVALYPLPASEGKPSRPRLIELMK